MSNRSLVYTGLIAAALILWFVASCSTARAAEQSMCAELPVLLDEFQKLGETPRVQWTEKDGAQRMLFISDGPSIKDKTWTLVQVFANSTYGCTMRSGVGVVIK